MNNKEVLFKEKVCEIVDEMIIKTNIIVARRNDSVGEIKPNSIIHDIIILPYAKIIAAIRVADTWEEYKELLQGDKK